MSSKGFSHLQIHLCTLKIPGRSGANQIDHVLMDARHASCILDVRSYRGANIDCDHYMVKARVRSRISMARTTANKVHKINLEALKDENVSKKFADSISLKLHHLQNDLPLQVNEHWNKCAKIMCFISMFTRSYRIFPRIYGKIAS